MVGAHAIQAMLGYDSLATHIDNISTSETDVLTYAASAVDVAYMGINSLVTARQASLMYRVEDIRKKKKSMKLNSEAHGREYANHPASKVRITAKGSAVLLALGATLAGQAAFGLSYEHGQDQARQNACQETVSQYYEEFEDSNDISIETYITEICK